MVLPITCRPAGLHYGRTGTACSALSPARLSEESVPCRHAKTTPGQRWNDRVADCKKRAPTRPAGCQGGMPVTCKTRTQKPSKALHGQILHESSVSAASASSDQASGCQGSSAVSRYYRDAKIMEIIEGTTQIHESILGKMLVDQAQRAK
jgi:hypothetical protein